MYTLLGVYNVNKPRIIHLSTKIHSKIYFIDSSPFLGNFRYLAAILNLTKILKGDTLAPTRFSNGTLFTTKFH